VATASPALAGRAGRGGVDRAAVRAAAARSGAERAVPAQDGAVRGLDRSGEPAVLRRQVAAADVRGTAREFVGADILTSKQLFATYAELYDYDSDDEELTLEPDAQEYL
jgi:hypothetical protein